jgi:hypothetical protein
MFGGQLPPSLMSAPAGSGPAVAPGGNPGSSAQSMSKVQMGLSQLQEALPGIPMGSELHKAVMDAVSKIGKHLTDFKQDSQNKMQTLLQAIQQMKAQQPNAALASMAPKPPQTPQMPQPPQMPQA